MAGYDHPYRSHNPYVGFDPWKTERTHNSEQLCCPALDESEGRRLNAVDPHQKPGTFTVNIESTVHVPPSMFSEFNRQYALPRDERRFFGVVNNKLHGPLITSNDQPSAVEETFNEIQNKARPPSWISAPRASYQHRGPLSAGYYGIASDAGDSDYKEEWHDSGDGDDSDDEEEWHEPITNAIKYPYLKADEIPKPPVTTEGGNGPRLDHPAGSVLPNNRISLTRCGTFELPIMTMTRGWEECGQREELNPTDERGKHLEVSKEDVQPLSSRMLAQRYNKPYGPSIVSNDQPSVVEGYFNKIQNKGKQPSWISAPQPLHQLQRPVSAGYHGITGNAGDGDHGKERHKPITNAEYSCPKVDEILKPLVTTERGNWRWPDHPAGSIRQSHHISSERDQANEPPIKEGKHLVFSMETRSGFKRMYATVLSKQNLD